MSKVPSPYLKLIHFDNRPKKEEKISGKDSSSPLIVRNLDGEIYFWNSKAEQHYGWSHGQALGSVSHNLLDTVFPEPLDLINDKLIQRGVWQGELIHTKSNGEKTRVSSRWELYRDDQGQLYTVLEINEDCAPLNATKGNSPSWDLPLRLRSILMHLFGVVRTFLRKNKT